MWSGSRRLYGKYVLAFASVISIALLASGALELYFGWRDLQRRVTELHRERALATASIIESKIEEIERALDGLTSVPGGSAEAARERMQFMCVRLLRQVPAISDIAVFEAAGKETTFASRLRPNSGGSGIDFAREPAFGLARPAQPWFGPVYFYRETEPYMTMVVRQKAMGDFYVRVSVNLAFMRAVISRMPFGTNARQYVVDSTGKLISDPDMKWVLNKTDMSALPQVALALRGTAAGDFHNLEGKQVVAAHAAIPAAGWHAFSEQLASEAYAPLRELALRSAVLLLLGFLLAISASVVLLRHILAPVAALRLAAQRFGEGRLEQPLEVRTGDEFQVLAETFNRMAAQIQASHANLEQEIASRTGELERAMQAKSRFLAIASHDLSQPMHALGLFVAALRTRNAGTDIDAIVTALERTVDAMKLLVDALLDISRLDSAPQPVVQTGALALRPFIEQLRPEFQIAAEARGLQLRVRVRDDIAQSDAPPLERIVRNLVANALRYTRSGGILIATRRRAGRLLLEVYDTGPGIEADQLERVFDEFYRIEGPGVADEGGLGLGLAIVVRLCQVLGHEVGARSRPGRGSVFRVAMLPAR